MGYYFFILLVLACVLVKRTTVEAQDFQRKSSRIVMDTTDFDELVESKTFVDKTLLIREVFKSAHHINKILAPKKFGKTLNLNTIRRFCAIEVDKNGNPKEKTSTSSYAIFKGKNLKVSKDEALMNTHFASYPVLYLDYTSLYNVYSYENLFEKLIILISDTFAEHEYLLKNETLWAGFEKGLFESYIAARENHKEHNTHILTSLKWLCEVLHKHFNRKVLVLIDNFDAYVYSAIFKDSKGIDKIMKLMMEIDSNMLRPNEHVSKVILTGSLKIYRDDINKDIRTYHFLEDHPFSVYYGLTKDELDKLTSKLVGNCGEKYKLLNFIESYYGSYKIFGEDNSVTDVYSTWPVINYAVEKKFVTDYLVHSECLYEFKTILKSQKVKEQLQALILGETVQVEKSLPFKEDDIRMLNYIVKSYICPPSGVEVFLRLLYSFGYLTPVKENKGIPNEEFKIPNNETCDELMRYTPV